MHPFTLTHPDSVLSPSLLFGWAGIRSNLARMIEIAGSPHRLRPHMKTHKTREITQLYLEAGITKHKCATLREAEVLAECGVPDVLIAYPIVGPNQQRLIDLARRFPNTHFSCMGDDVDSVRSLDDLVNKSNVNLGLFVDFNVGQNRTGLLDVLQPLQQMTRLRWMKIKGIHLYDGLKQASIDERRTQIQQTYERACEARRVLGNLGESPSEIVLGGTPAFLLLAQDINDRHVTLSPGTCILHDAGYGQLYPDLGFVPAASVLTRCISRPGPKLVTFDIGTKAVCADPPFGQRVHLIGLESATCTLHNEEHLVVETDQADQWKPGMVTYAIPKHICPTVAMYSHAHIVEEGRITRTIEIAARGR